MNLAKLIYDDINSEFGHRVTIEFNSGADIDEMMQNVKQLLLGAGYHPKSVKEGFIAMAEEYEVSDFSGKVFDEEDLEDE